MSAVRKVYCCYRAGCSDRHALLALYVNHKRLRFPSSWAILHVSYKQQGCCNRHAVSVAPAGPSLSAPRLQRKINLILALIAHPSNQHVAVHAFYCHHITTSRMFRSSLKIIMKMQGYWGDLRLLPRLSFVLQGRGRTWQWRMTVSWRATTLLERPK
jgi:hypothetical protein